MKPAKKKTKGKGVGDMPPPKGSGQMAAKGSGGGLPKFDPKAFAKLETESKKRMQAAAAAPPRPATKLKPNVPPTKGKYKRGEEAYSIMGGK